MSPARSPDWIWAVVEGRVSSAMPASVPPALWLAAMCEHRGVGSLYDELGVAPSADQEQLHRAYRRRARELHPDVNDGVESDAAMRRLNDVWAVLGDPEVRLEYDQLLRSEQTAPPTGAGPTPASVDAGLLSPLRPEHLGWFRVLRPSVIIPATLLLIFIGTAYAGHSPSDGSTPAPTVTVRTASPTSGSGTNTAGGASGGVPAVALVGRCIRDQSGSVLLVPCSDRPNSLVVATMPVSGRCPTGTSAYVLAGQTEMVCASPAGP
jgi:DnaJ domain